MIGAGDWSSYQLRAWQNVQGAEIVALCDRDGDRLAEKAAAFDIQSTYTDASVMLTAADLDFVDICVRPAAQADLITMVGIGAGLPVLCQKPFCTSLAQAQDIVAECDAAGARLMINENFRWQAWYRTIKHILDSGVIGEPFYAQLQERSRLTMPVFNLNRQAYLKTMPQLIVYEMVVHFLDTFRYLFGEPEIVHARLGHISSNVVGEDVAQVMLGYPALTVTIYKSWASVPPSARPSKDEQRSPYIEIDGTEGTLVLARDRMLRFHRDDSVEILATFDDSTHAQGRVAVQQHFIDCLRANAPFETSGADYVKTMALVYASYQSADENRVVCPADLLNG